MMTLDAATWWTSSYTKRGATCVEVTHLVTDGQWAVRDSKDRTGSVLLIPRPQWAAFAAHAAAGRFGG